jgi:hypothetical protein
MTASQKITKTFYVHCKHIGYWFVTILQLSLGLPWEVMLSPQPGPKSGSSAEVQPDPPAQLHQESVHHESFSCAHPSNLFYHVNARGDLALEVLAAVAFNVLTLLVAFFV